MEDQSLSVLSAFLWEAHQYAVNPTSRNYELLMKAARRYNEVKSRTSPIIDKIN